MRFTSRIKPITHLKKTDAEDIASCEKPQEAVVLLKILALGNQDIEAGKVRPVADVVARLRRVTLR